MTRNILLGGASVAALTVVASFWGTSPASATTNPTCTANGSTIGAYPYSPTSGDVIVCTASGSSNPVVSNAAANNVQFSVSSGATVTNTTTTAVTLGNMPASTSLPVLGSAAKARPSRAAPA